MPHPGGRHPACLPPESRTRMPRMLLTRRTRGRLTSISSMSRSAMVRRPSYPGSICASRRENSSPCWGRRAAARPRCCASSPACCDADSGTVDARRRRDITDVPPHKRDVGVVFQNYALFPHLTVAENVAFGLKVARRRVGRDRAGGERAPSAWSISATSPTADLGAVGRPAAARRGGAGARGRPEVLLLDEPFSALDRKLRETMQIELRRLLRGLGTTAVFVTHDQDEALTMSDRIAVMNGGRIEQLDRPPRSIRGRRQPFALEFVGLSSRLAGTVSRERDGLVTVETASGRCRAPAASCRAARPARGAARAHHGRAPGESGRGAACATPCSRAPVRSNSRSTPARREPARRSCPPRWRARAAAREMRLGWPAPTRCCYPIGRA